jgi:hypothetical protein
MIGGRRMATIPARINRTLSAMDQLMDFRGIEEQAAGAAIMDTLQKFRNALRGGGYHRSVSS